MFRITLILFLLAVALMNSSAQAQSVPNVLFILVDDLGWRDLGCYGSSFHETPNLDAFANESMQFQQAYAASPVCSPSRAAIMTGLHPARLNITDWIPGLNAQGRSLTTPEDLDELPLSAYTMAEAFRDNGYATFFAGKWHLGGKGFLPEDQGFDHNIGGFHKGSPPGGYYSPYHNPHLPDGPEGEYLTDRLTNEAITFIQNRDERPFFLFLSYYTVHTPIQANKRHEAFYEQKLEGLPDNRELLREAEHNGFTTINQVNPAYASMVAALDENVGQILHTLREEEIWEETIIVFTSDNGGLSTLPERRVGPTSVRPLRAGKGWCYEGGIRVPLMMRIPGITLPGSKPDILAISQDFFPTLAAAAGLNIPDSLSFDGRNLLPAVKGKSQSPRTLFWHYPHYHGSTWTPGMAIRYQNWKLIHFFETETRELYDLMSDPGEKRDLSQKRASRMRSMEARLIEQQQAVGARLPTRP